MKNTFRKGLILLMILCLLVPLFGVPVLAENAGELPIDYQFKDVDLPDADDAQVLAAGMTNDPYSSRQWCMKMIGMEAAWKSGLTGRGVRVAVIDGGVTTKTNDIDPSRLLSGKCLVDGVTSTEDTNGHGTFIAGIIGATKDNGVGIAGVAPGVTIVPIKITTDGTNEDGIGARGIYAAVDEFNCDVINYSSGAKKPSTGIHEAIQYAVSKGVIVVCSTGNDGTSNLHYPGAFSETIGVGSVNQAMERSSFSHTNNSIFVVAPGEDVTSLSTRPSAVRSSSGTSFSAPFVAGLAALLKQAHPQMNTDDFKEILKMSSKDLGKEGYDVEYGYGLIQVPAAIREAAAYFGTDAPAMPDSPDPTPDPTYNQTIWDRLFNFDWLRELFQNIIRSIFKGWSPNLTF